MDKKKWIHKSVNISSEGYTPKHSDATTPQHSRGRFRRASPEEKAPPTPEEPRTYSDVILIIFTAVALVGIYPLYTNYTDFNRTVEYTPPEIIEVEPLERWEQRVSGSLSLFDRRAAAAHYNYIKSLVSRTRGATVDPDQFARLVVEHSIKWDLDPIFVTALAFSESTFRVKARSGVGARGLLQLMPGTGQYTAKKLGMPWKGVKSLENPEVNVALGVYYLRYLFDKFDNNEDYVMAAYNWGPGNVSKLARGKKKGLPRVTKYYIKKIRRLHALWAEDLETNWKGYIYGAPNSGTDS